MECLIRNAGYQNEAQFFPRLPIPQIDFIFYPKDDLTTKREDGKLAFQSLFQRCPITNRSFSFAHSKGIQFKLFGVSRIVLTVAVHFPFKNPWRPDRKSLPAI
jgi:hypothetical protein